MVLSSAWRLALSSEIVSPTRSAISFCCRHTQEQERGGNLRPDGHIAPPWCVFSGGRPDCTGLTGSRRVDEARFRRRPLCELRAHAAERSEVATAAFARGEMFLERPTDDRIDVVVEIRDECFFAIARQIALDLSHGLKFATRVLSARPIVWLAHAAER